MDFPTTYQAIRERLDGGIKCDDCGVFTNEWDWSSSYDRVCLDCIAKAGAEWDYDPRADRGCHEYHQSR